MIVRVFLAPGRAGWTLGAAVFATGIAYWPGLIGAATAPRWAALALGLAALAWFIEFRPRREHLLLAGTLGYAALSLGWAADPAGGVDALCHLALFLLAVLLGMAIVDLAPAFIAAGLACLVMLPWVLVQAVNGVPATGLFLNRDSLAQFAALAALGLAPGRRQSLAWPALFCLGFSFSLGGAIALLTGWIAGQWRQTPGAIRWVAAVMVVAGGGLLLALEPTIWLNSILPRFAIWRAATAGLSWQGAGIGGFTAAYPGWFYAHNDLLQLGYELGLGAAPLVLLAALAWRRSRPDRDGLPELDSERAVLAGFVAEGLIGFPLFSPATALLAGLVAGRLLAAGALLRRPLADGRNPHRAVVRRHAALAAGIGPAG